MDACPEISSFIFKLGSGRILGQLANPIVSIHDVPCLFWHHSSPDRNLHGWPLDRENHRWIHPGTCSAHMSLCHHTLRHGLQGHLQSAAGLQICRKLPFRPQGHWEVWKGSDFPGLRSNVVSKFQIKFLTKLSDQMLYQSFRSNVWQNFQIKCCFKNVRSNVVSRIQIKCCIKNSDQMLYQSFR